MVEKGGVVHSWYQLQPALDCKSIDIYALKFILEIVGVADMRWNYSSFMENSSLNFLLRKWIFKFEIQILQNMQLAPFFMDF